MLHHRFFFLMIRRPPRSTLFPYTTLFRSLKENAKSFSPEKMAPVCGVPAQTIREVARLYATSKGSMILWGMGISQHVHGDRKSTRLNSSHSQISYAVFCLKKKKPDCSPRTQPGRLVAQSDLIEGDQDDAAPPSCARISG